MTFWVSNICIQVKFQSIESPHAYNYGIMVIDHSSFDLGSTLRTNSVLYFLGDYFKCGLVTCPLLKLKIQWAEKATASNQTHNIGYYWKIFIFRRVFNLLVAEGVVQVRSQWERTVLQDNPPIVVVLSLFKWSLYRGKELFSKIWRFDCLNMVVTSLCPTGLCIFRFQNKYTPWKSIQDFEMQGVP